MLVWSFGGLLTCGSPPNSTKEERSGQVAVSKSKGVPAAGRGVRGRALEAFKLLSPRNGQGAESWVSSTVA